jgi:very-short-patch-repair endonuclease
MARRKIIPYNPKLKLLARELRNRGTLAKVLLWNKLKGRKMGGYQFFRQKPLDKYIVDFFCYELMLAIEIDGISHREKGEEDRLRQKRLESFGIRFIRITESEVKKDMLRVLKRIEARIDEIENTIKD